MGQNEIDATRKERLVTRDQGRHISRYIQKACSAIYLTKSDQKPLTTVEAFKLAADRRPEAAKLWIKILDDVSKGQCLGIFERIPETEITGMAIEFAFILLRIE
jgi:hypothetical protein